MSLPKTKAYERPHRNLNYLDQGTVLVIGCIGSKGVTERIKRMRAGTEKSS